MNNDDLFDKIRIKLTEAEASAQGHPDWNQEDVWSRVQKRNQKNRKPIPWWFAAAGISLLITGSFGLYIYRQKTLFPVVSTQTTNMTNKKVHHATDKISNLKTVSIAKQTNTTLYRKQTQPEPQYSALTETTEAPIYSDENQAVNQDSSVSTQLAKIEILPDGPPKITPAKPQRVLVVDLTWEEENSPPTPTETTFMERVRIQAKRIKTEHKFDLKALDKRPGNGIWSFVGQSFVEPSTTKQ